MCWMAYPWVFFKWILAREYGRGGLWEISNGPRLGETGGDLVRNCEMGLSVVI